MKKFNPVPSEEILKKINFYFFPYSPVINTNRCMTFEIDEKQDYIKKLRQQYESANMTKKERV
jgi:hypothetical protein